MKRWLIAVMVAVWCGAVLIAWTDGPLTPLMNLAGRTDENGYLRISAGAAGATDGPLTPLANLRGRTDESGYLRVSMAGAQSITGPLLLGDGTSAAPVIARAATPTMGLYFPNAFAIAGVGGGVVSTQFSFGAAGGVYQNSAGIFAWMNTSNAVTGTVDTIFSRQAAGIVQVGTTSANTAGTLVAAKLDAVNAQLTAGAAAGVTTVAGTLASATTKYTITGATAFVCNATTCDITLGTLPVNTRVERVDAAVTTQFACTLASATTKYTITGATAFVCNAVTCDITLGTLPVNTRVERVDAAITTQFACTAVCTSSTLSLILGKGAGAAEYLASFDADAATGWFGDADAEMGTLMTRAAAIQGGTFSAGTQAIVLRLTSGTGNVGNGTVSNLSGGVLVVRITTTVMP
jgi:hypothetical protein